MAYAPPRTVPWVETFALSEVCVENEIELDVPTHTSAAGLIRLTAGIFELLNDKAVDSRFVAKLLKRLDKEAQLVAENRLSPLSSADELALRNALAQLKHALNQSEASLLVQTNAKLRSGDAKPAHKKNAKKMDAGL